jgi:hypothetical protein
MHKICTKHVKDIITKSNNQSLALNRQWSRHFVIGDILAILTILRMGKNKKMSFHLVL